jgi:hypothetical protein
MFEDAAARSATLPERNFRFMEYGDVMQGQYSTSFRDSEEVASVQHTQASIASDLRQYFEYLTSLFHSLR